MKWTFSVYVHVYIDAAKTSHETIVIENTFEDSKMFTLKSLIDSVQVEVKKRNRIFDYIVVVKIKPFIEQIGSINAKLPVLK